MLFKYSDIELESVIGAVRICNKKIQHGRWHVVFRKDLAEEVKSEISRSKMESTKSKEENIKILIQSEMTCWRS